MFGFVPESSFQLGPLNIYWYGICITLGIVAGYVLAIKRSHRYQIPSGHLENLLLWVVPAAIIGARLYHVILEWDFYSQNLGQIFNLRAGGIAIHGAILGGLAAVLFYTRWKKIELLTVTDLLAPSIALGQAIGRFGNFFNQELYGRPTSVPWALEIDQENRPAKYLDEETFHPTFFYESFLNLTSLTLMLWLARTFPLRSGAITAVYMVNYGLIRFLMEFLRIDEDPVLGPFKFAQLASLILIALGSGFLIHWWKREELLVEEIKAVKTNNSKEKKDRPKKKS